MQTTHLLILKSCRSTVAFEPPTAVPEDSGHTITRSYGKGSYFKVLSHTNTCKMCVYMYV